MITDAQLAERDHFAALAELEGWCTRKPLPDSRWTHLMCDNHRTGWELVIMWSPEGCHITAAHERWGAHEQADATTDDLAVVICAPEIIPRRVTIDLREAS